MFTHVDLEYMCQGQVTSSYMGFMVDGHPTLDPGHMGKALCCESIGGNSMAPIEFGRRSGLPET